MPSIGTDSHYNLGNLRPWHRSRTDASNRPSSSSSLSSTEPSRPVTPQESAAVLPPLISQSSRVPRVFPHSVEKPWGPKLQQEPQSQLRSEGARSGQPHDEGCDFTEDRRSRTNTVTPATIFRDQQHESPEQMRIPFPGSNQRDSTSSSESRPSYAGSDSSSMYDDELGGIPARHPLRNRMNSKGSSLHNVDADGQPRLSTKSYRVRAHTHRPDSSYSTQSTQSSQSVSSESRSSLSLRLKPKKSNSQRGAMNLFRSLASSPHPSVAADLDEIEFDWAEQRRQDLERQARRLEQEYDEERRSVHSGMETDNGEEGERNCLRPRSWELTPEELQLRRAREYEDWRKFMFKDRVYVNGSYVSPHPKDIVPYPLGYDAVNLQTDRHSNGLLTRLFSGRPSIHDDVSQKPPATVLDLGCGDGSWIVEAAHSWKSTLFYGLDLQNLHPSRTQLVASLGGQGADNIRFTYYNFVQDKLPYLDEKFDLVRMANLKWAIPEDKWDFVLEEVHRVLKRGGWVEIIDDEFLIGTSSSNSQSAEQRTAFETLEAQFKAMLGDRNLLLNTSGGFMHQKLGAHFSAFHEDDFPIAISKTRPVSVEMNGQAPIQLILPSESVSHKAAKLMGIGGLDPGREKHRSFGSTRSSRSRSRSRSGSVSSTASYSTQEEAKEERDEAELTGSAKELTKQSFYQPLGLDVHPGRFIPFPPNELNAHAVRNMQSILSSKEAIRSHMLRKNAELEELEVKDELTPEEKQRFEPLSREWDEQRQAFEDAFWDFETGMLKRLGLPQRFFDFDDDEELPKLGQGTPRPQPLRTASGLSKLHLGSDASLPSPTTSIFAAGSNVTVRIIRVHSGWK